MLIFCTLFCRSNKIPCCLQWHNCWYWLEDYYYQVTNVPGLASWSCHSSSSDGDQPPLHNWIFRNFDIIQNIDESIFERLNCWIFTKSETTLSDADKTSLMVLHSMSGTLMMLVMTRVGRLTRLLVAGKDGLPLTLVGQFKLGLRGETFLGKNSKVASTREACRALYCGDVWPPIWSEK